MSHPRVAAHLRHRIARAGGLWLARSPRQRAWRPGCVAVWPVRQSLVRLAAQPAFQPVRILLCRLCMACTIGWRRQSREATRYRSAILMRPPRTCRRHRPTSSSLAGVGGRTARGRGRQRLFDALMHAVGLAAVLAARLDDGLPDAGIAAFRLAACRQQAGLGVGASPVAQRLGPDEAGGSVGEAPRLDGIESLLQRGPCDPCEQGAMLGRQFPDGECRDVLRAHGFIVRLGGPRRDGVARPRFKGPRGVDEDGAIRPRVRQAHQRGNVSHGVVLLRSLVRL